MRLLIDANLSVVVAETLRQHGHDAQHVREIGLQAADDETILQKGLQDDRVIVSEDTDFGALLARHRRSRPSFVLLATGEPMPPGRQVLLLLAHLPIVEAALNAGAIVVLSRGRIRIRSLPIEPPER